MIYFWGIGRRAESWEPCQFPLDTYSGKREMENAMDDFDIDDYLTKKGLTRDELIGIEGDPNKMTEFLWKLGPCSMLLSGLWILYNKHDFFDVPFPAKERFTFEAVMFTLTHAFETGQLKATFKENDTSIYLGRPEWSNIWIERDDLMKWLELRKNKALIEPATIKTPTSDHALQADLQAEREQHEKTKEKLQALVDKLAAVEQERDILKSTNKEKTDSPADERSATSFLHLIGAMVEIIIENKLFKSETALREHIHEKYTGFSGCAFRTMAGKFAEAKKLLSE